MPEFFRIDEFAIAGDPAGIGDRERTRHWSIGFDISPAGPSKCPQPPAQRFFRIDEFSARADTFLDDRDKIRFYAVGFDIEAVPECTNLTAYINAPGLQPVTVTDQDILNEVQFAVAEEPVNSGQSYASDMWTADEVISYLNQRTHEFLKLTAIVLARQVISSKPQVQRLNLPVDWVSTQRVAFRRPDGSVRNLTKVDHFEVDQMKNDWQYATEQFPVAYTDENVPTQTLEVMPQARDRGQVEVVYVPFGSDLSNTGVPLPLPADFAPAIRWGVLADMLGKVGRAHDPGRALAAEQRFRELVEASRIILDGWP